MLLFFFFKQKTAYEMRISDWSSDVCSSDLGISGVEVYRKAPPIPAQVVAASGEVLMTKGDIMAGQAAWQSHGGMQLGSIWGHGAYQAPDWSADWLPRELTAWLSPPAPES